MAEQIEQRRKEMEETAGMVSEKEDFLEDSLQALPEFKSLAQIDFDQVQDWKQTYQRKLKVCDKKLETAKFGLIFKFKCSKNIC